MLDWLKVQVSRVRGLMARRRIDQDFEQELGAHLALLVEENVHRGMAPEERSAPLACDWAASRSFGKPTANSGACSTGSTFVARRAGWRFAMSEIIG
jgi:hypothetical protein